jgi:hypothetical protein
MSSSSRSHGEICPSIVQAREEPPLVANEGNVAEQGPVRLLMTAKEIEDAWQEVAGSEEEPEAAEVREGEEDPEAEQDAEQEPESPPPTASNNINLEATITEDLNNFLYSPKPRKDANAPIRSKRANESPVAPRNQRATRGGANVEGAPAATRARSNAKGRGGRKRV